jgi:hypothetical protein
MLSPAASDPWQSSVILTSGNYATQERAELTRVVLDVSDVNEVQLAASAKIPGESRRASKGFHGLRGY